ncbi:MAG: hypothetical protein IJC73_07215 [Lentisphaeria bacterium]|nr:hypothetical protein [Lentisphaeria bacterium]
MIVGNIYAIDQKAITAAPPHAHLMFLLPEYPPDRMGPLLYFAAAGGRLERYFIRVPTATARNGKNV